MSRAELEPCEKRKRGAGARGGDRPHLCLLLTLADQHAVRKGNHTLDGALGRVERGCGG